VNEGRGNTYALSVLKPDKGFVPILFGMYIASYDKRGYEA
jgi:hypothetical protein